MTDDKLVELLKTFSLGGMPTCSSEEIRDADELLALFKSNSYLLYKAAQTGNINLSRAREVFYDYIRLISGPN